MIGDEQAKDIVGQVRERLGAADLDAHRALDDVERQLAWYIGQHELAKGRVHALEGTLKQERAGQGSPVMRDLESLLRAGADAIMQQRLAEDRKTRARVWLDDRSVAVVIDSLTFMREHLTQQGIEPKDTERALALVTSVVDPETSVVELETRLDPSRVQGTA